MEMRRKDASLAMDLGVTRALQLMGERQAEFREAETALMREWNERIIKLIDDNRKHDIARTEALAEKMARDNQIEELSAQYAREREEMASETRRRISELEAEMVANRERAVAELNEREAHWNHTVALEQQRTQGANELVGQLQAQMAAVEESTRERYEERIRTLEQDKDSYSTELERANVIQSRANKILVVLVVVLTIAALAVGMIIGWAWFGAQTTAMALPNAELVTWLSSGATL